MIVPVSAAMLHRPNEYDASLEAFSRQLMPLVDYVLDDDGRLTVRNETTLWYRFIDLTAQAEALFRFLETAIEVELESELEFLARYGKSKAATQEIVDMPDRKIDLFIRLRVQNHGRLSASKRESQFAMLSDCGGPGHGAGSAGRVARRPVAFAMTYSVRRRRCTQRSPGIRSCRGLTHAE
ncbi:MAG: hypothetical protein OXG82_10380 [Gammaproteobacteria bacterium]|nr:hypothetical protein [Gammaproteobacteria bacterium]